MAAEYDSQYLKSVTALGDTHRVVTNRDIYSGTGIKLVTSGTCIDSSFYDKLVRHKLMPQIDECLTIEDGVTTAELLSNARQLFEKTTWLSKIPELVEIERLWSIPPRINLVNALSFKLTVARESRPELLDHSLQIMLLSLYLGMRQDLHDGELTSLATAAVFHDLGNLHIDPAILAKPQALTPEERKHIYTHPMVAFMILKEFPEYHPMISTAVLKHHEYLDGSGYPAGLLGDSIDPFSQILGISEVTVGIPNQERLEIVLKLNKHKLNTDLIGYTIELFKSPQREANNIGDISPIAEKLARLAKAFEEWDSIAKQDSHIIRFANRRIQGLRFALFDAGFNPLELAWLTDGMDNDPRGILDVESLIGESYWQIQALDRELSRLWPNFGMEENVARNWIDDCLKWMAS